MEKKSPRTAPLWVPSSSHVSAAAISNFISRIGAFSGRTLSFDELHEWSVQNPGLFWSEVWDFCKVIGDKGGPPFIKGSTMLPRPQWFPTASFNFAENLLRRKGSEPAIIFRGEDQKNFILSFDNLRDAVASVAAFMKAEGIREKDVVAGYLPNVPEAVIAMLATAALGAIWCSCSPDFGVAGAVDRFAQIAPKILFTADGYYFKGSTVDSLKKARGIRAEIPSIVKVVVIPYVNENPALADEKLFTQITTQKAELEFKLFPFDHPLYVMFSSGTTGKPKCLVHGAGGTLLEHLKEHVLHTNLKEGDRLLYLTTTGWMMWNWYVSALAAGASLVLYDGFFLEREGMAVFELIAEERVSVFGTSAKFLSTAEKLKVVPEKPSDLHTVHTVLSTGSPLTPQNYDYVYGIMPHVQLSSISGGTDIIGCFALGAPNKPVYYEELQAKSLGIRVEVWDDNGIKLPPKVRGELVCTKPFPSQPLSLWNDVDASLYRKAYFEKFPGIWRQGDFVSETEHGGLIIHGRSDATLNPGGVRIGTAEIYRQVEKLEKVLESLVVGKEVHGDIEVALFVKLRSGTTLDEALKKTITQIIRLNATPYHVPKYILQVEDIPRTKNGKLVELAVREVINGREVKNVESLANPEALEFFKDRI